MEQRENIQLLKHKDQSLQCIYQEQFGGPPQYLKYGLKENESVYQQGEQQGKRESLEAVPTNLC